METAWFLAESGFPVELFEMRPVQMTPAHTTAYFSELVCSNSLKSKNPVSPAGQLKTEMEALGSIVLQVARQHEVPGGQALAVDRDLFGQTITNLLSSHPKITVRREPFTAAMLESHRQKGPVVLATGPLTSDDLSEWLASATGREHLHFYDAVSPTVEADSIDLSIAFAQSRYDKGGDDYLNCPMNREEYEAFVRELTAAERAPIHAFEAGGNRDAEGRDSEEVLAEKIQYFSGCMPIEAIADRGERSLAFGNFKPVGLTDPRTGRRPYAALQLRPENAEKSLYTLVACQTRLKWGEQKRVFRMIPGLQNAEFVRYGVIHRNTYLDAPKVLNGQLEIIGNPGIFVTGQLTGVEGYVESAAMGLWSGLVTAAKIRGIDLPDPGPATAYGALLGHLRDQTQRDFAPMNINWGLLPSPEPRPRDKGVLRETKIRNACIALEDWVSKLSELSLLHRTQSKNW